MSGRAPESPVWSWAWVNEGEVASQAPKPGTGESDPEERARDRTAFISGSPFRSLRNPQDLSRPAAPTAAGPESWGSETLLPSAEKWKSQEQSRFIVKCSRWVQSAPSRAAAACSTPIHFTHKTCLCNTSCFFRAESHTLSEVFPIFVHTENGHAASLKTKKLTMWFTGAVLWSRDAWNATSPNHSKP